MERGISMHWDTSLRQAPQEGKSPGIYKAIEIQSKVLPSIALYIPPLAYPPLVCVPFPDPLLACVSPTSSATSCCYL